VESAKARLLFVCSAFSFLAGAAHAAQPTDVVTSDANDNTAMGLNALYYLYAPAAGCTGDPCIALSFANTAAGAYALQVTNQGSLDTGFGAFALGSNTTGSLNTAVGVSALGGNTAGEQNTAVGVSALYTNTTGEQNTAVGTSSLFANTTGNDNTAVGEISLFNNTTGYDNTSVGDASLVANTTGFSNSALGWYALSSNTTGQNNTAFGASALFSNTTGKGNAAQGANALYSNTTGIRNLAVGNNALVGNVSGSYNLALGFNAGSNVTTGSNNIEIGTAGTASDNDTIQIGVQGTQTSTTIAGIYGTTLTGSAVYVTPSGQLGVLASSERFKTDVQGMGSASDKIEELRPVTFKLKNDPRGTVQYGLIAEEVAKVYPELVIRGADGRIDGVRYEELAPLLLNLVKRQQAEITEQQQRYAAQAEQIAALSAAVEELKHSPRSR
jgi:hypothetical protein